MKILCAIHDRKADCYLGITIYDSELLAIREASLLLAKDEAILSAYPEDFELCVIGSYDTHSGEIVPCLPRSILEFAALIKE